MTIYLASDPHGSYVRYQSFIDQISEPSADDYIIICGDAGLEYGSYHASEAKDIMRKFPGKWIIMRGNHDTRYWRDHWATWGWSITDDHKFIYEKYYPNILYTIDFGGIIKLDGYKFLFIPGSYSVDKSYRLSHRLPFEPQEQLNSAELEELNDKAYRHHDKIDFIVAHTAPIDIESYIEDLFLQYVPQDTVDKTMEHAISNILDSAGDWKHYFFGHFHDDREIEDKYTMLYNNVVCLDDYIKD